VSEVYQNVRPAFSLLSLPPRVAVRATVPLTLVHLQDSIVITILAVAIRILY